MEKFKKLGCFDFLHVEIYPHIYKLDYELNTKVVFSLKVTPHPQVKVLHCIFCILLYLPYSSYISLERVYYYHWATSASDPSVPLSCGPSVFTPMALAKSLDLW